MSPSNNLENHGSDLLGPEAKTNPNKSPHFLLYPLLPTKQRILGGVGEGAILSLSPWKQGLRNEVEMQLK